MNRLALAAATFLAATTLTAPAAASEAWGRSGDAWNLYSCATYGTKATGQERICLRATETWLAGKNVKTTALQTRAYTAYANGHTETCGEGFRNPAVTSDALSVSRTWYRIGPKLTWGNDCRKVARPRVITNGRDIYVTWRIAIRVAGAVRHQTLGFHLYNTGWECVRDTDECSAARR